tara:strand:+ start:53 stop:589 length:537 start_codon:yes stop_codon:yes gene_type:complete
MISELAHSVQEFILNDSIHLILFFTVLSTFYFFYVTKQEEAAQMALIETLLHLNEDNDFSKNIKLVLGNIKKTYPELIEALKKQSDEKQKQLNAKNMELKKKTYFGIILLLVVLTIVNVSIKIYYKQDYMANFKKSIVSNVISVLILGGVEFLFFTLVVKHYNIINDKNILYTMLNKY